MACVAARVPLLHTGRAPAASAIGVLALVPFAQGHYHTDGLSNCNCTKNNAELQVTGAMMSNRAAGLSIEDHAILLMQGGGASCMVETGYLYPAPNSVFDLHYSIRTEKHYFAARDNSTLEIVTNDRQRTTREMKLTNVFFYPEYVRDTLRRVREGLPPIADLSDNAAAVELIEAGYAMSPLPVAAKG